VSDFIGIDWQVTAEELLVRFCLSGCPILAADNVISVTDFGAGSRYLAL